MIELAITAALLSADGPAPLIDGAGALSLFGGLVLLFGTIAVFRTGANNRIDAKRESELTRLDGEVTDLRDDVASLRGDIGTLSTIATRAVRAIQNTGGTFPMTAEEIEVLERTRPIGEIRTKET